MNVRKQGRGLVLISASRQGKKGNVSVEVVIVAAILFTFALAAILVYDFFTDLVDDITDDDDYSATATAPVTNLEAQYPSIFDTAFVIILGALWIATIVSAFQIDTYPVFFGISVLALIIVLVVPPILANAFEETMTDETTTGLTDSFPVMNYVMTHLLQFSIFIGASVLISLYAKTKMSSF